MKLVILADDFTGAIDTGVQFAKKGVSTGLYQESSALRTAILENEKDVYVVNTETRHLSVEEAYQMVHRYTKIAVEMGVHGILKKTDSGLRGNIGSELVALLDATSTDSISFIPAYPQMNRITINGIHYIEGKPIHESVFGRDPFEPVTTSKVKDLIQSKNLNQYKLNLYKERSLHNATKHDIKMGGLPQEGILIFDAQTKQDIQEIIDGLFDSQKLFITAGCASLGEVLAEKFYCNNKIHIQRQFSNNFFVVCGSVNDVTRKQVEFANSHGFYRESFSVSELLGQKKLSKEEIKKRLLDLKTLCEEGIPCIIDTGLCLDKDVVTEYNDEAFSMAVIGTSIARELGAMIGWLVKQKMKAIIMVIGGDTLQGVIKDLQCEKLQLYDELAPGVALCGVQIGEDEQSLITKSGGFGQEDLLINLREQFSRSNIKG